VTVWLVLCQDGDGDAADLAPRLRERGLTPLELVLASELVHGVCWDHRLGTWGSHTRLLLADGREFESREVDAVLNRLYWVTAGGFLGASETDREYAGGELYALVQSWLASFGARMVNQPAGLGLAGSWRTTVEWRALARGAGLAVRPYPESDERPFVADPARQVLVVDGAVVEDVDAPADVREGAVRLAQAARQDLVELSFDDDWAFADATLLAALAHGNYQRVQAVALALRSRSDAPAHDRGGRGRLRVAA
jgi:hypothetical protein